MFVVTDYNSIVPYLRGLPTACVKTPVCRMVGFANLVPKEEGEKEKTTTTINGYCTPEFPFYFRLLG